jgi:NADH-quinone oxidoreductase subunit C
MDMDLKQYTDELTQYLNQNLGIGEVVSEIHHNIPVLILPKNQVHKVLAFLKKDEKYGFSFFTTMCGIHFPDNDKDKEFALMYQLHNMAKNIRLRIRTYMAKDDMEIETITDLWRTTNWMEREAFDFYGFTFKGHPDLRRIMNMDEMDYHPMRKEYALEDGSRTDKEDKYFGR